MLPSKPALTRFVATVTPPLPAPTMTTSELIVGNLDVQTVQLRAEDHLAAQPRALVCRWDDLEHVGLVVAPLGDPGQERLVDEYVAGAAVHLSAAFGNDPWHVVVDGVVHDGPAD